MQCNLIYSLICLCFLFLLQLRYKPWSLSCSLSSATSHKFMECFHLLLMQSPCSFNIPIKLIPSPLFKCLFTLIKDSDFLLVSYTWLIVHYSLFEKSIIKHVTFKNIKCFMWIFGFIQILLLSFTLFPSPVEILYTFIWLDMARYSLLITGLWLKCTLRTYTYPPTVTPVPSCYIQWMPTSKLSYESMKRIFL